MLTGQSQLLYRTLVVILSWYKNVWVLSSYYYLKTHRNAELRKLYSATNHFRSRSCNTGQHIDTVTETSQSSDTPRYTLWSPVSHFQRGCTCSGTRGWRRRCSTGSSCEIECRHRTCGCRRPTRSTSTTCTGYSRRRPRPDDAVSRIIHARQAKLVVRLMLVHNMFLTSFKTFNLFWRNLKYVFLIS